MAHAYIAFAEADRDTAERIAARFSDENVATQSDPDRARGASQLSDDTAAAIANAFAFIVLVSPDSVDAPQVRAELEGALARAVPILPVRIGQEPLPNWWRERIGDQVTLQADPNGVFLDQLLRGVRRFFDRLCPVISLMNLKGGVGKTTVAAQVFAAAQRANANRILLVDLDPQHNLSQLFFRRSTQDTLVYMDASVISLFEPSGLQGFPSPAEDWRTVNRADAPPPPPGEVARRLLPEGRGPGRLDIVCGQFDISKYSFLEDKELIECARRNFVTSVDILREHYDLVVLDTNPAASFLTRCAFAVSSRILAPVRADRFSLRGVRLLNELVTRLLDEPGRAPISILFNGVERSQVTELEADVRAGRFDEAVGFSLGKAIMKSRMPFSKFLSVRDEGIEDDPLEHLAIYRASGIWGGALKDALNQTAAEMMDLVDTSAPRRAA